ncbi:hypothetical protein ACHAXR_009216 [Thalassiosira sp. AJA248-18]
MPASPDLIIRISLVRDDSKLQQLDPPIWRTFKVSSSVNLDLLADKVITPVMGWTRNYHNEYRGSEDHQDCLHFVQTQTTASDAMHVANIVKEENVRRPEDATIGDLLKEVGDRCLYNYDLGDCWYHILEVEKVIPPEEADGAARLMDGAMRCPADDGDGCGAYQRDILNLLLKVRKDPTDDVAARKLAQNCFEKFRNNLNVLGPFRPEEFDLPERREELQRALRSRNSTRDLVKTFSNGVNFGMAKIGQRHVEYVKEDDRADPGSGGNMSFHETLNVKPDPKDGTLCYSCGTPHNLKGCSRCKSSFYCSPNCQAEHWNAGHKQMCKGEKNAYDKYKKEVETNTPDPNRFNQKGGSLKLKRFIPGNLRFQVGDRVECLVGEDLYGTGRIVKLNYRESSWPPGKTAPYQIKMDRETADRLGVPFQHALIYSDWDDDLKIRRLPDDGSKKKKSAKGGKKGRRKK